jgi:hypothetical protein
MPKPRPETAGHYELRAHPKLRGIVNIWWCPAGGPPAQTNMSIGAERVPLLAEALADWELAHAEPPAPPAKHVTRLRAVGEDGTI